MGLLPTGTANDQGKSFGLSAGAGALKDNVAVIKAGITTKIDAGHIQLLDAEDRVTRSDLFFDSASIGWGAAVLVTRNRDRRTVARIPLVRALYRDQLVYAGAMMRHLVKAVLPNAKFSLEAVVDGETHRFEGLIDVIIKNTHVFGGEWVLAPDAEVDDGLFEMIPVAGTREFTSKMLATFRHSPIDEANLESIGIDYAKPIPGSEFVLTILHPGEDAPAVQIDGEEFPAGDKLRIDVLRRALCIIVPREAAR
jgi:diacylglycerol kinase family enzyme